MVYSLVVEMVEGDGDKTALLNQVLKESQQVGAQLAAQPIDPEHDSCRVGVRPTRIAPRGDYRSHIAGTWSLLPPAPWACQ